MPRLRSLLVAATTSLTLATGIVTSASTGAGAATAPKMTRTEVSYARSVLSMLNAERVAHGLPKLRIGSALTRAAQTHNRSMASANNLSHQLPGERFFADRDRAAGWHPQCYGGENIGVNGRVDRGGATQLQSLMYNERPPEDGHRLNILGRHYTHVGIAVYLDRAHHRLWLTTDFAQKSC